jgi:toxin FitB
MNVVDSSGWLEYLADGTNAAYFAPAIEQVSDLIVPTLSIYEVFKRILQQRDERDGLRAVALMQQGIVVDLGVTLAVFAAQLSMSLKLPMADSVMLATARQYAADFWTQDAHFQGIEGVHYLAR